MDEKTASGFALPSDWILKKAWGDWALEEKKGWKAADVKRAAKKFHEYHLLKQDTRDSWGEWELSWRSWVVREKTVPMEEKKYQGWKCNFQGCEKAGSMAHQGGGPWYCSDHFLFNSSEGETPCLI